MVSKDGFSKGSKLISLIFFLTGPIIYMYMYSLFFQAQSCLIRAAATQANVLGP